MNVHTPMTGAKVSLVVPCHNMEAGLRAQAQQLCDAMRLRQVPVELVLVDNGSRDGTGARIDALIEEGWPVRKVTVAVNRGFGFGVLRGLEASTGEYVGFLRADEISDASDIASLCQVAMRSRAGRLYKLRRQSKIETRFRRITSKLEHFFAEVVFGNLGSGDWSGNAKIFPRSSYRSMKLYSKRGWFLDAEVMVQNRRLGLPVFELNVFGRGHPNEAAPVAPKSKAASAGNA